MKRFLISLSMALITAVGYAAVTTDYLVDDITGVKSAQQTMIYGLDQDNNLVPMLLNPDGSATKKTTLVRKEASQDLSVGALAYTTDFAEKTRVISVMVTSSAAISQTIGVGLNSSTADTYDTLIASETLESNTSFVYIPDSDLILEPDDELDVTCTNTGTPAATVYVTIIAETLN